MKVSNGGGRRGVKALAKSAYARLVSSENVDLGPRVDIGIGSTLWAPSKLVIGPDVYIGRYCTIMVDGSIGRGSMIANNVGIVGRTDHDHRQVGVPIRFANWVGDSPQTIDRQSRRTVVGEDVWIGFGAVIVSGVTIGRGAIVAAGSVVSRDVDPYAIVAGNPGVVVGQRYDAATISQHEVALLQFWADRETRLGSFSRDSGAFGSPA